jgi:crotonobetainyl-CoA:carnitine CoA-transferase CaiB-like acyl-CoA transferase
VYEWEQVHSQGLVVDVEHPVLGTIALPGPPLRFFSAAEGTETTNRTHLAPPLLNQHGTDIRSWLEGTEAPENERAAQA